MQPRTVRRLAHVVLPLAILDVPTIAAGADWKPDRSIEIIVPTGPGSGVDNTARTVQTIPAQPIAH